MMKRLAKPVLVFGLALLARGVLHRYQPHVVMVTGSVGKTSTKDAVAAVLAKRFLVRKSEKSFNSEFGVPFTILGADNPWSNPLAWVSLARKAVALLILPNQYPNLLVLEVGSGKPGDLAQILRIAKPDALVVTRLPEVPVHVEFYPSPEAVREEEFSPAYALAAAAPLIVSADDPYALLRAARVPARLLTYGLGAAQVRLTDIEFDTESDKVVGMKANVTVATAKTAGGGSPDAAQSAAVRVKGSVGKTQLLPAAAAIAAATAFDISLEDAVAALASYEPPAGRGRLFNGVAGSTLIDDSYNASPVAVEEALETLATFPAKGRRIAILGDMLELGRYSVAEHERVGAHAAKAVDILVTVGIRAKGFIGEGRKNTLSFDDSRAAAATLPALIEPGDVILVKGSQSIRTERIVEALLANRVDLPRLPRQESAWKRR